MANLDPIVLYIVVNDQLHMSPGKIAAQTGHLVEKFLLQYMKLLALSVKKDLKLLREVELDHIKMTSDWVHEASTILVKKANGNEWLELKTAFGRDVFIVSDIGKSEVEPGSETCLATWPIRKSSASELIQRLPLL